MIPAASLVFISVGLVGQLLDDASAETVKMREVCREAKRRGDILKELSEGSMDIATTGEAGEYTLVGLRAVHGVAEEVHDIGREAEARGIRVAGACTHGGATSLGVLSKVG